MNLKKNHFLILIIVSIFSFVSCSNLLAFSESEYLEYNDTKYYRIDSLISNSIIITDEEANVIEYKDCTDVIVKSSKKQNRKVKLYKDQRFILDPEYDSWYVKDFPSFVSIYNEFGISTISLISCTGQYISKLSDAEIKHFDNAFECCINNELHSKLDLNNFDNYFGVIVTINDLPQNMTFGICDILFDEKGYHLIFDEYSNSISKIGTMWFEHEDWSKRVYQEIQNKIHK